MMSKSGDCDFTAEPGHESFNQGNQNENARIYKE